MKDLIYKAEIDDIKIREYLKKNINLSSRFIKKSAFGGRISVNGEICRLNYILKKNDIIRIEFDAFETQDIMPQNIDIDVVYEDDDVLVVNKPAGMVVHPTKSHLENTLANGVLYYFMGKNENCIVRLVSRLDMDTSGLILIAKNQYSHMALANEMKDSSFEKSYMAVASGTFEEESGTINLPIIRPSMDTFKREVREDGKPSITHYKVLDTYNDATLLKLTLETGRTHQIRVHLSHIGHPIFGDKLYGGNDEFINRQALHAYKLSFPHPRTKKIIELETNLPSDIENIINQLKTK